VADYGLLKIAAALGTFVSDNGHVPMACSHGTGMGGGGGEGCYCRRYLKHVFRWGKHVSGTYG
jgi:hypothetical protein